MHKHTHPHTYIYMYINTYHIYTYTYTHIYVDRWGVYKRDQFPGLLCSLCNSHIKLMSCELWIATDRKGWRGG